MSVLPILQAPDPRLKTVAEPVLRFDEGLGRLLDDMLETMYQAPGIGLAAPQVGVARRAFVLDLADKDQPRAPLCVVNPAIVWQSPELVSAEEGCLSLPDHFGEVARSAEIEMHYRDRGGEKHSLRASGLLARCLQHELDHLNGVLFIDHLSVLKRSIILRKLAKAKRGKRASA